MKELENWECRTQDLTYYFIEKYFGKEADQDWYWVADKIGGVLSINDYFFNLSNIVDFIRYKYSKKDMFMYYEYSLELSMQDMIPINIKNYKKLRPLNIEHA